MPATTTNHTKESYMNGNQLILPVSDKIKGKGSGGWAGGGGEGGMG